MDTRNRPSPRPSNRSNDRSNYRNDNSDLYSESPQRQERRSQKVIGLWRKSISTVIGDNFGEDQIELHAFNIKEINQATGQPGLWKKIVYWRNLSDLSDFIGFLNDGADKLEESGFIGKPDKDPKASYSEPYERPRGHGERKQKIISIWRKGISLVVTENFGEEQIELHCFNQKEINRNTGQAGIWKKVIYWRNLGDLSEFINYLNDMADKLETAGFVGKPEKEFTPRSAEA